MEEESPSTTRSSGIAMEKGEIGLKEEFGVTAKKRVNSDDDTSLSKKQRILKEKVDIKEEIECSSCDESFSDYRENPLPVAVKEENEMGNTDAPDPDVIYRTLRDDVKEEIKQEVIEEYNHGLTQAVAFGLKSNVLACPFCQERMGVSALSRHFKTFHSENPEKMFGCIKCDVWCKTVEGAYDHYVKKGCTVSIRSIEDNRMLGRPLSKMAAAFGLKSNVSDCPFCEETMGFTVLDRHFLAMHGEKREKIFGCTECDVWCKSVTGAYLHYEKKGCIASIRTIEEARKAEKLLNMNGGDDKMPHHTEREHKLTEGYESKRNINGKDPETSKFSTSRAAIPESTEGATVAAPIRGHDMTSQLVLGYIRARSKAVTNEPKQSFQNVAKKEEE